MKMMQAASMLLGIVILGSAPASATRCRADLFQVANGGWVVTGYSDARDVMGLLVEDASGAVIQQILTNHYGQFSAAATFPVVANQPLTAVFIDRRKHVICTDDMTAVKPATFREGFEEAAASYASDAADPGPDEIEDAADEDLRPAANRAPER